MFRIFRKKTTTTDSNPHPKWNPKVADQFEQLLEMTPRLFRKSARAAVTDAAFKSASKRNAKEVEEWDLVHAYLKETPDMFKAPLFKNALTVGIDMESYLPEERVAKMQALSSHIAWEEVEQVFHPDVTWFEWAVTKRCNLRCTYCFEAAGKQTEDELTTEQAHKVIRSLGDSARTLGRQFVMLWSGGEPLTRKDLFELMACAHEEGMLSTMATNGSLITPHKAAQLKEIGVATMIITLDSLEPEIHDAARGKGSHAEALAGIRNCKEAGLLTMVETVATKHNWQEVAKLRTWADKEGFIYFHRPLHQGGRTQDEQWMMSPDQYRKLYLDRNQHLFDKLKQGKGMQIPLFDIFDLVPFAHTPSSQEERDHLEWGVGCQACRLLHGISATGDLLPCIRLKTPLGSLLEQSFVEISKTPAYRGFVLREGRGGICAECEHVSMCGGGCLAETSALKGDPFAGWDRCRWVTER